jgi:hypothetical protein
MDTNDSEAVDIGDAIMILNYLFCGSAMIAPNGMDIRGGEDRCRFYPGQHIFWGSCNVPCSFR